MNYNEKQILELKDVFKFTDREARFVWIVANATGYFLRRHIRKFFNTADGKAVDKFIKKLKARKLIKEFIGVRRTKIYHLFSKKIYEFLDRESNLFWKEHEVVYITQRLILLDFLIQKQENNYIFKTDEKVKFFSEKFGISKEFLPARIYRFKHDKDKGFIWYFADKTPIIISQNSLSSPPVVSFMYPYSGLYTTLGEYEKWIERYAGLFSFLPNFNLIFISTSDIFQEKAEEKFNKYICIFRNEKEVKNIKFIPYIVPKVEEIFEYSY